MSALKTRFGPWHTNTTDSTHVVSLAVRALQEPGRLSADGLHTIVDACQCIASRILTNLPPTLLSLSDTTEQSTARSLAYKAMDARQYALDILDRRYWRCRESTPAKSNASRCKSVV